MIRRRRSNLRDALEILALEKLQHLGRIVELENDFALARQRAAKNNVEPALSRLKPPKRRLYVGYELLRLLHHLYVPLVGLHRRGAPRDQAVIHQHNASGFRIERRGNIAAETKSRTAIRNRDQRIAEAIADRLLPSARVRQRKDRVGVRVQHRRRGKEGMQKSLDRRTRPAGIEKASPDVV